ncbi:MAG: carboxypeptidase regulatory-like domain-containing protein [Gemmatimonadales bacterium]|nr:MAG: carboxypeptidase regulatory-like domain-containing protein [Gemmatimonadales bacterium]
MPALRPALVILSTLLAVAGVGASTGGTAAWITGQASILLPVHFGPVPVAPPYFPVGTHRGAAAPPVLPPLPSRTSIVEGRVRESGGRPIAGAAVRIVGDDRIYRSVPTDEDGYFRVSLPTYLMGLLDEGRLLVRVERMGYAPVEQLLRSTDEYLDFVLAPAPIALEGFRVEAIPAECRGDDPEGVARRLWEEARARHPGGMDTLGVAAYMLARVDTLPLTDGATPLPEVGHMEAGQRGSAPILRLGWDRRIQRSGYAFPVRRTDRSGSYASWSYPPLEADMAPHFGTALFGERHYFQLQDDTGSGWWIRFCARDNGDPHLDGLLRIGPDTLIQEARWRIRTPDPSEAAGGRAVFPPQAPDGKVPPLLPMESEVRANHRGTQTVTRIQWFEDWLLAPGDSVPFLPRRSDDRAGGRR